MRWLKRLLWGLLALFGLLAVVLVGAVVFLKTINLESWREEIKDFVATRTGRELHIMGPMEFQFGLTTRLRLQDVSLSNASWSSEPVMFEMGRFDLVLDWRQIFNGVVEIGSLQASDITIVLENDKLGRSNLDLAAPHLASNGINDHEHATLDAGTPDQIKLALLPLFRRIDLVNIRMEWIDHQHGVHEHLHLEQFQLVEVEDHMAELMAMLEYRGQVISASGRLGAAHRILNHQSWPVALDGKIGTTVFEFEGKIDNVLRLQGFDLALHIAAGNLAELAAITGRTSRTLPLSGPGTLHALVKSDPDGRIRLDKFELMLGEGTLPLSLHLGGTVDDLVRLHGIHVKASLHLDEAAEAVRLAAGFARIDQLGELPSLGPATMTIIAAGDLDHSSDHPLALPMVMAEFGKVDGLVHVQIDGAIADLARMGGTRLNLALTSTDFRSFAPMIEPWMQLSLTPLSGAVQLRVSLQGNGFASAGYEIPDFAVKIDDGPALQADLSGSIKVLKAGSDTAGKLANRFAIAGDLSLSGASLDRFRAWAGPGLAYDLAFAGEASISGQMSMLAGAYSPIQAFNLALNPLSLRLGNSDLGGKITVDLTKDGAIAGRPDLRAELTAKRIDLVQISASRTEPESHDATTQQATTPKQQIAGRLLPDRVIKLPDFNAAEGQIGLHIDQLVLGQWIPTGALSVQSRLHKGMLELYDTTWRDQYGTLIAAHTTIAPDKPGGEDKIKLDTRLTIKPFNAASVLAVEGLPLP
ncbi:MAG: AsmA family protein, partial [Pseudomonadota bacterium]